MGLTLPRESQSSIRIPATTGIAALLTCLFSAATIEPKASNERVVFSCYRQ
jgi:hypothetical protein